MGLRINTNVQALTGIRSLGNVKAGQDKSLERLSSGARINKASDDAAGLAISEKMRAEIRSSQQASRNAGDGISLIQTAEGGLSEVSNILIRLRELSIQAASDTVGDKERSFTNMEFKHLVQEVNRIANSTQYNGNNLLNGAGGNLDFQIGIKNSPANDRISFDVKESNVTSDKLKIAALSVAEKKEAQNNLNILDDALNSVNKQRANLGAIQNRFQSTITNLDVQAENLSAANSRIRDTDVAEESAALVKSNILTTAATAVLMQANNNPQIAMRLIG